MNKYYTIEIKDDATVRINKKEWDEFIKFRQANGEPQHVIRRVCYAYGISKDDLKSVVGKDEEHKRKVYKATRDIRLGLLNLNVEQVAYYLKLSAYCIHKRMKAASKMK